MPIFRYIHISQIDTRSRSPRGLEIDQAEWFQNLGPIRSNPLLVETCRLADNYVIASPPVNSSGDVYHYLAYLILCRAKKWYVPRVYIGYDDATTRMHATRCIELARQLGFTERVIAIPLDQNNGATHANVREKQLRDEMNERELKTINQKGVTTLLACAYRKYGYKHITAILQQGFLQFDLIHIN